MRTGTPQDRTIEILSMGSKADPLYSRLAKENVEIHVEPDCRLWNPMSYVRIFKAIRRINPDVIHLHLTYATIIGAVAGKLAGYPVVASVHNTNTVQAAGLRGTSLRFLETTAIRLFVDRVIFVGKVTAEANRDRFGRVPMVTIDNVVEPPDPTLGASRKETREALGARDGEVVVLSAGRLTLTKNIGLLLDAFAQVVRAHPGARLWVCGNGETAADLGEQANTLGIGDAVVFLGERNDVPVLMHAADIFVLSSDAEGLPLALLEAMSAGLPVVATAVGSVPDYVEGGAGLIVAPRQVDDFARALDRMVGDAAFRADAGRAALSRANAFTNVVKWREALEAEYMKAKTGTKS
ncbi:glycosyltransferase [Tabrizicola sp. BL-A-41-H6]|uniref:glycosyltransferase n=1 Tax=Tabrizicola sp. BL-A-41-H6 TaxID=3421107 RepID=UPI003D67509E